MQNDSTDCNSRNDNVNSCMNGAHLSMNNENGSQVIKWIKTTNTKLNKIEWKPVFIVRSSAPNRKDCKYFIVKTTENEYRTYHIDELYEFADSKCSKNVMIKTLLTSLHHLFSETTIKEERETPLYLYRKRNESESLFSYFNIFKNNNELLSLDPIKECEFHESSGIDEYNRKVTGIWIKTENNKEKIYHSMDKLKTIQYIDDVNPVQYKSDNEWIKYKIDNNEDESLKLICNLKKENDRLLFKMNELKERMNRNNEEKLNRVIIGQKRSLESKQKEIDRLRLELIARSNAKQLNSKFPTISEVCDEYHRIKNQEFQSVHSKLSKPLRKHKLDWNKYYVNKLSHKLLFETLCKCYSLTLMFHDDIYQSIGDILQISYNEEIDDGKNEDNNCGNKTLEFLFHRYLTNNYDSMKESKKYAEMIDKIWRYCLMEYKDIMDVLSNQEQEELSIALKVYINKCCDCCWTMVLQRPKLTLSPSQFVSQNMMIFDEAKHQRILGSNKKDKYVLYFVWPGIKHNQRQLENIKIYVIQRDNDFSKMKK